jgi:hypothetical protein
MTTKYGDFDKDVEDIDIDSLTKEEKIRLEKYQSENCTSRCGNDIDCPHEEEFLEQLQHERVENYAKSITQPN